MKKIKSTCLLVLICSLFTTMILNNTNIQQTKYVNITDSAKYKESNNANTLNYFAEKQYFSNIQNEFDETGIANGKDANLEVGPFVYQNLDYFSGKTLIKIGIPVKTVEAVDENQTFTLYVVDKTALNSNSNTTANKTYELKLPKDQLGDSTTVNKWVYVDLSKYGITLTDNETLSFSASTDTVSWGYNQTGGFNSSNYKFKVKAFSKPSDVKDTENIFFDIHVAEERTLEISNKILNQLNGLNFSILGDSISTYKGYSNNSASTNSTIGSNAIFYNGSNEIKNVNDTWWMQTVNNTGMNLLVNNSYSGDTVAKSHSTRSLQLHDDTGDNAGTNPDIIAVYFGINDIKNGSTVESFKNNYSKMINNIRNKYTTSKIFVFTHVPYYYPSATVPTLEEENLEEFNNVIRDVAKTTEECYVVDLFANSGITNDNIYYYMYDTGLHPSVEGMDMITKTFIQKLDEVYSNLPSDNDNDEVVDTPTTPDDKNQNEEENNGEENNEKVENPFTSTSLIKIISLIFIVGAIIVLSKTIKRTKINKYE